MALLLSGDTCDDDPIPGSAAEDELPATGGLACSRAAHQAAMAGAESLRRDSPGAIRTVEMDSPRRPAVRQRRRARWDRTKQGSQGHRREVPDDARERRAVRARVGLSWPADRAPDPERAGR